jgi:hypothetical protein
MKLTVLWLLCISFINSYRIKENTELSEVCGMDDSTDLYGSNDSDRSLPSKDKAYNYDIIPASKQVHTDNPSTSIVTNSPTYAGTVVLAIDTSKSQPKLGLVEPGDVQNTNEKKASAEMIAISAAIAIIAIIAILIIIILIVLLVNLE